MVCYVTQVYEWRISSYLEYYQVSLRPGYHVPSARLDAARDTLVSAKTGPPLTQIMKLAIRYPAYSTGFHSFIGTACVMLPCSHRRSHLRF